MTSISDAKPQPPDAVDGIPDRSTHRPRWAYMVLLAVFLAWVAFLLWVLVAGAQ